MGEKTSVIPKLIDKIVINATLELKSGLHIGASNDFSPIGSVDSVVIRDSYTKQPMIPGTSVKGKMRTLLARTESDSHMLKNFSDDSDIMKRLFGASAPNIISTRLIFSDLFMTKDSVEEMSHKNTDLYLTEIKFENTINRLSAVANPRQLERVPRGARFAFQLVYNVEDNGSDFFPEVEEDFKMIVKGLQLLQMDYIGGSGSRGYGKIAFNEFNLKLAGLSDMSSSINLDALKKIMEGAAYNGLLQD